MRASALAGPCRLVARLRRYGSVLLVFMLGFVGYRRVCTGAPARATAGALSLQTLLFQVRRVVRAAASAVAVAFRSNAAPSFCEIQFSVAILLIHFEKKMP